MNKQNRTRRHVLQAGGLGVLGTLAGCTGLPNGFVPRVHNRDAVVTAEASQPPAPWPTVGHDARRTNIASQSGPTANVAVTQLRSVKTFPAAQPIITNEYILVPELVDQPSVDSEENEFAHRITAIRLPSAQRAWTVSVPHAETAPTVAGQTAFCPGLRELAAVDLRNGSVYWRYAAGSIIDTGSPVVVDGMVVVPSRTSVIALDAVTGQRQWQAEHTFEGNALGVAVTEDVLVTAGGSSADATVGLARHTGERRWRASFSAKTVPVSDGARIYIIENHRLHALSATDGSHIWTRQDVNGHHRPAVGDSTLYIPSAYAAGNRDLLAIDTATGSTKWRTPIGPKVLTGPPVGSAESVYVQTAQGGQPLVIAYNRTTGERRWKRLLPVGLTDALALGDNALYLFAQPEGTEAVNHAGVYILRDQER